MEIFPNEDKALEWFEAKHWDNGVTCPSCGKHEITNLKRAHFYKCSLTLQ